VVFEFMQHELELTRACLTELSKLGSLSCNASPMEDMRFLFPEWTDPDTLIDQLTADREVRDGDIFVKIS
jgi:hypothetical protein